MCSRPLVCSKCGALAKNTYNVYPSPPSDMLNSNTVFSATEIPRFSKTISDVEADLSRLDDEMSQLQIAMDHLATERQKLAMSLDEYRSLVAPIRRIPPEILSEMFMHCLVDVLNSINVTKAPLHLTFVCSKWRRVAISTPRLWSYISLYRAPIVTELLQTWLLRSGSSPLTLVFKPGDDGDDIADSSYFDTIIPHSHRWRDVTFTLVDTHFVLLEDRAAEIKDHLPILERLHLECVDIMNQPLTIFENAPMLNTVTLMEYSQYLLPWHQLKHHRVDTLSTTECLQLLQQCTNLTHCNFENLYNDSDILNTSMVVHSQLQSMCISQADNIFGLLDNIVLPALQVLAIYDDNDPSMPQPHVSSLLDRSSCNLQCLTLQINWTGPELIVFLQGLPSLVEVAIEEVQSGMVNEQLLRQMTHDNSRSSSPGSHVLVPKLKRLSFSARLAFDHKVILDMVQSRRGHPVLYGNSSVDNQSHQVETLDFIFLNFRNKLEPEAIAQITSMQEGGLEVQIMIYGKHVL